MAKKSLIAKAKRAPKHKAQAYHRCTLCGRPRAYMRRFALCRILLPGARPRGRAAGGDEVQLVSRR